MTAYYARSPCWGQLALTKLFYTAMSRKVFAVLGAIGFFASAGIAFAQSTTPTSMPTVLQVNKNGSVLMRGTIDTVSAGSLTVKSWGGDWTVNVSASAKVVPSGSGLTDFKQGDFVGVIGTADMNGMTITASLVRDWSARQALNQQAKSNIQAVRATMAERPRVVQGTLSNLDTSADTFTLTNAAGTAYVVSLDSGAKILGKNWATITLDQAANGNTVRVYGVVSSSTIAASVFRDVSVK